VKKPSNSQIRNAGEVFKNPKATALERNNAFNIMNQWRVLHEVPLNTFQATLRRRTKQNGLKDAIVVQRLKKASTIIDKLSRYPNMCLDTMQDIGGLRVILKSVEEVEKIKNIYLSGNDFFKHQLIKEPYDYINQLSKKSGYRAIHLIYKSKYDREGWEQYSDLRIELQLRTELQHIWATTLETASLF
jgi:ppGpp synthetase/RelA/SpoT-type nucleotidyltranferase